MSWIAFGLKQISAPAVEPVNLDEVKLHLRLDSGSSEDTLLTSMIAAARQYCENFQRRAYITQTWELWFDTFKDIEYIYFPFPPLQSVTSIKYYNHVDTEYTLSPSDYIVDTKSQYGRVSLAYGKRWPPSYMLRPVSGVCVTYVCGYGDTGDIVPERIRQAILLTIGHFYENREAVSSVQSYPLPMAVDSLLWLDRCF